MSYKGVILSCGSIFKVSKIIQEPLPGIHDIEQDLVTILDCWHHRLDQVSMFNTFLPEEWVGYDQITPGYDNVNGNIVYA